MAAKMAMVAVATALLLAAQASAAPPAWACGTQTDYYAKTTTVCADATCNASQRNLGGELLVLDTLSYGQKGCQGCNPAIPATCCQTCKDTDNCNVWVVCTNKDGCGSGCQAYAKQFKLPLAYSDPLPHRFWGNWGGCAGDKWPFGMCSLKVAANPKSPPVLSTGAADGWVSGVVPKTTPAAAGCPAGLSATTCKLCLSTKSPAKCFACIKSVNRLDGPQKCATCLSLATPASQEACVACAAKPANDCLRCLEADCTEVDCANARTKDPTKAPNLGTVDQCFACQAVDNKPAAGGMTISAKAGSCATCYETWNVPKAQRASCTACVGTSPTAAAAGCGGCHAETVKDRSKCLACLKNAKSGADGSGCASCSNANMVPAQFTSACQACVIGSANQDAKSYCGNLEPGTTLPATTAFYKCLAAVKVGDSDGASSCWQCYRSGSVASAAKCYECMSKVSPKNGIHCSHCWVPSKMASDRMAGSTSAAEKCEKCVIDKDKAGGEPGQCW